MAFDPHSEDFQRLGLRYAQAIAGSDPFGAARASLGFGRRYLKNRDSLPQSDGDRAFHLVVEATELIDYRLPFAPESEVAPTMEEASRLLDKAYELDRRCYDAMRMRQAFRSMSFESHFHYLSDHADEVKAGCEEVRQREVSVAHSDVDEMVADIAMRPYMRWMAALSARALVCGRYRCAVSAGEKLLAFDPDDKADVRFTLALAYAKLEDEHGLDELIRSARNARLRRGMPDPWELIARMALAHRNHDRREARRILESFSSTFAHGARTLAQQLELPDGVYARLPATAGSEDEIMLAVSEATVLLQEGRDPHDRGTLGWWVMSNAADLAGEDLDELLDFAGDEPQEGGE